MTELDYNHVGEFNQWRDIIDHMGLHDELETATGKSLETLTEDGLDQADGIIVEEVLAEASNNYVLLVDDRPPVFTVLEIPFEEQEHATNVIKHPEDPVAKCPGCGYDTATSYLLEDEDQRSDQEYAAGICGDCFAGSLAESVSVVCQR